VVELLTVILCTDALSPLPTVIESSLSPVNPGATGPSRLVKRVSSEIVPAFASRSTVSVVEPETALLPGTASTASEFELTAVRLIADPARVRKSFVKSLTARSFLVNSSRAVVSVEFCATLFFSGACASRRASRVALMIASPSIPDANPENETAGIKPS